MKAEANEAMKKVRGKKEKALTTEDNQYVSKNSREDYSLHLSVCTLSGVRATGEIMK